MDNLHQTFQCLLVWLAQTFHELAKLQVDADDVGPQLLHLSEVGLDLGPLGFPIVFEEASLVVVVVIETEGDKRTTRRIENKPSMVLGDLNERPFGSLDLTLGAGAEEEASEPKELGHCGPGPIRPSRRHHADPFLECLKCLPASVIVSEV